MEYDVTEEEMDEDLSIDVTSAFALQKVLVESPKKEARYYRLYAYAQKKVDKLTFELEILSSSIISDIIAKKIGDSKISASLLSELRKSAQNECLSEERYVELRNRLIDATEEMNILKGATFAFSSRSKRLTELSHLMRNLLGEPDRVFYEGANPYTLNKNLGKKIEEASETIAKEWEEHRLPKKTKKHLTKE